MKKLLLTLVLGCGIPVVGQTTWHEVSIGVDDQLNCIDFPSSTIGYIGGNDSTLLKTTDGGTTWSPVSFTGITFYPGGEHFLHLQFLSETIGYATIGPYGGTYKTIDGGTTWTLVPVSGDLCFTGALYFFGEDEGLIGGAGCFSPERIDVISTGGSFTPATIPNTTASYGTVIDFDFYDANYGLAASDENRILKTLDGGATWDTIATGLADGVPLTSVEIINDTLVYAGYNSLGSGFGVLVSVDAGATWEQEIGSALFSYPSYNDVKVVGNGDFYTAGESTFGGGVILEKSAGAWTYQDVDQAIRGIDYYDSDITWCVGDSGYVVVNKDPASLGGHVNDMNEFSMYPTPVSDILFLELDNSEESIIQIYNVYGQLLIEERNVQKIYVEDLENGMYIIVLNQNNQQRTKQFLKI